MTVKFLAAWNGYKPGETEQLPERLARHLITREIAESVHVESVPEVH